MSDPLTGRCLCGDITWRVSAEPIMSGHCACDNCRRMSGAEHATFFAAPAESSEISGEPRAYSYTAGSGATVTRHFCGTCGSTVCMNNDRMAAMRMFPVGALDDIARVQPQMFVFHAKAAPWDRAGGTCATFEAMPPMPG